MQGRYDPLRKHLVCANICNVSSIKARSNVLHTLIQSIALWLIRRSGQCVRLLQVWKAQAMNHANQIRVEQAEEMPALPQHLDVCEEGEGGVDTAMSLEKSCGEIVRRVLMDTWAEDKMVWESLFQ
jgi:hypothetical protein